MAKIKTIKAYEIIDSRGWPTIEGRLILDNGLVVETSIPAGYLTGKHEAVDLRDNDKTKYLGMGVSQAISYINDLIAPKLVGVSPEKQREIDYWLIKADGTNNKSRLGANTILTISQLVTKAQAKALGQPLFKYVNFLYEKYFKEKVAIERIPSPIFNILNGGKHANNELQFQEFQIVPSSSLNFGKAYEMAVTVYHELRKVLEYRHADVSVGEEGGFSPHLSNNVDGLELLDEAISNLQIKLGTEIFLGIDLAASHYYQDGQYTIRDISHSMKVDQYLEFILNLTKNYSFLLLEDPLYEDDWDNWTKLNKQISKEIYLVGDDLLTTNKERLEKAIKANACSSISIKPSQVGTISETLEVINLARKNNFSYIVSERSGETEDTFIADFSVGVQADFVKFGAPARGERVAKYNRLWKIERDEL